MPLLREPTQESLAAWKGMERRLAPIIVATVLLLPPLVWWNDGMTLGLVMLGGLCVWALCFVAFGVKVRRKARAARR